MKNFVKKLSFVLAAAMVVTSVAVPVSASAATKGVTARYAGQKKSSTVVTSKTIWAGGKKVNFDYVYGKKTSGVKGTWTSSDPSVVTVDSATGKATALKKGDVTVTFTPKSKKYAAVTVAVKARVRATSIILHDGADRTAPVVTNAALKVGESKTYYAELRTKTGTKSSYFVKAATSNASAAAVKNGAEDGSYKGDNYGRNVTVTANATGSSVVTLVASPYSDDRTSTYDVKAEFPVVVKKDVSTIAMKQVEAREVKLSNVATTAGIHLVKGQNFSDTAFGFTVESTTANADGTFDAVLKVASAFDNNQIYSVFYKDGVKFGSFVAEAEKPADVTIDPTLKVSDADDKLAVATVTVKNQWGNPFSGRMPVAASYVYNNSRTYAGVANNDYSLDKTVKGVYYFTVQSDYQVSNTDPTKRAFKDGDTVALTVFTTDPTTLAVTTKQVLLSVSGKTTLSGTTLVSEGFYVTGDTAATEDRKFTKKAIEDGKVKYSFFVAYPTGKAAASDPKGSIKAYLDGDTSKTLSVTSNGYSEKLAANGVYNTATGANVLDGEWTYFINLHNDQKLTKGTHTITVTLGNAKLTSQSFTVEEDVAASVAMKDDQYIIGSIDVSGSANVTSRTGVSATVSIKPKTTVSYNKDKNNKFVVDVTFMGNSEKDKEGNNIAAQLSGTFNEDGSISISSVSPKFSSANASRDAGIETYYSVSKAEYPDSKANFEVTKKVVSTGADGKKTTTTTTYYFLLGMSSTNSAQ